MHVKIFSPVSTLFDGMAESVFLPGDQGEFELLNYHAPILGLLREGHVTIDWTTRIPIKKAIVKFDENECVILVDA
jgi:F-type H+-transporting ATPase subunit epsilon